MTPGNTFFPVSPLKSGETGFKEALYGGASVLDIGLTVLVEIGGFNFESGSKDFHAWSYSMVGALGEGVQPLLLRIWQQIPLTANSHFEELVPPTITQQKRTELMLLLHDFIGDWQQREIERRRVERVEPVPHNHSCPVCGADWMHTDPDCRLPDEYWCDSHTETEPLPVRLKLEAHDHYCEDCCCYWGHSNRNCCLPEVYPCEEHGGIFEDDSDSGPAVPQTERPSPCRDVQPTDESPVRRYWPLLSCAGVLTSLMLSPFNAVPAFILVALALRLGFNIAKKRSCSSFLKSALLFLSLFVPTGIVHDAFFDHPTALCGDGSYSYSAHHQGTCSWHHAVAEWYPEREHWWQF